MDSELITTICLVRHGQTVWNDEGRLQGRSDVPLDDIGREQAAQSGQYLAQSSWDAAICSPLGRTRETTQIILRYIGAIPVTEMAEFVERDYGAGSGLTQAELQEKYPNGSVPGMEESAHLTERVVRGLSRVLELHAGRRVIIVSHGGAINAMLWHLSDGKIGTGKTKLRNACLSTIIHDQGEWRVDSYDVTVHLNQ